MTPVVLLGLLPWVALGAWLAVGVRNPRPLPAVPADADRSGNLPPVTVVVPARNEARNIERCLASLAAQRYPDFEIVVVDDRSTDDTAERARRIPAGRARSLRVLDGAPLPEGWFGKPWACLQGANAVGVEAGEARAGEAGEDVSHAGPLLLFTDADTRHGPDLLVRAVTALLEDRTDAVTLHGRQELGSFGERLVQPQIFALLALRYGRLDRVMGPERARDAIANGQYLLVREAAYRAIGGHEAVRGEVVEDLRIAQVLAASGHRISMREAEDGLSTRMYRSFREVADGWTKNLAVGARQSAGPLGRFALPAIVLFLLFFWVLPPGVLLAGGVAAALNVQLGSALFAWALLTTIAGFLLGSWLYGRFDVSPLHAALFPVGATLAAWIVVRSWRRGTGHIEWKGRRYALGTEARRDPKAS